MDKLINDFIEIRNFLVDSIDEKLDFFLKDLWDPIISYILIQEIYKLINNDLASIFPFFPKEYFPKIKLRLIREKLIIQRTTQHFLNKSNNLIFLGNADVGSKNYDLYYKETCSDPTISHVFFARFDHKTNSLIKGARTAATEYFTGKYTPLSVAYHIAHEDGVI
jgi:hypothetical protein